MRPPPARPKAGPSAAGDHPQRLLALDLDDVAAVQPPPAPGLGLAVDAHRTVHEQRARRAAALRDADELQELAEADLVAADGDVAQGDQSSRRSTGRTGSSFTTSKPWCRNMSSGPFQSSR
jgi:hypothetical protein